MSQDAMDEAARLSQTVLSGVADMDEQLGHATENVTSALKRKRKRGVDDDSSDDDDLDYGGDDDDDILTQALVLESAGDLEDFVNAGAETARRGRRVALHGHDMDEIYDPEHDPDFSLQMTKKQKKKRLGPGSKLSGPLQHLMGEANFAYTLKDFDSAIETCMKIILECAGEATSSSPCSPVYHLMGMIYEEKGEIMRAAECLEIAATLPCADPLSLYQRAAPLLFKCEQYDRAVDAYSAALKLSPKNPDLMWDKAWVLYTAGRYSNALSTLNQLYKVVPRTDPGSVDQVLQQIGLMYKLLGEAKRGADAFRGFVTDGATLGMQSSTYYAEFLMELGNYEDALGVLEAASVHPGEDSLAVDVMKGVCLAHVKSAVTAALDFFSPVFSMDVAQCPDHYMTIANTYFDLGEYQDALNLYNALIAVESTGPTLARIGDCHRLLGDTAAAMSAYRRVLNMTDDVKSSIELARLLKDEGEIADALEVTDSALEALVGATGSDSLNNFTYPSYTALIELEQEIALSVDNPRKYRVKDVTAFSGPLEAELKHTATLLATKALLLARRPEGKELAVNIARDLLVTFARWDPDIRKNIRGKLEDERLLDDHVDDADCIHFVHTEFPEIEDYEEIVEADAETLQQHFAKCRRFWRELEFNINLTALVEPAEFQVLVELVCSDLEEKNYSSDLGRLAYRLSAKPPQSAAWHLTVRRFRDKHIHGVREPLGRPPTSTSGSRGGGGGSRASSAAVAYQKVEDWIELNADDPGKLSYKAIAARTPEEGAEPGTGVAYHLVCGNLAMAKKALDAARVHYTLALKQDRSSPLILLCLASTFLDSAIRKTTYDRHFVIMCALAVFNKYAESSACQSEVFFNMGRAYHQLGLTSYAINFYDKVLTLGQEEASPGVLLPNYKAEAGYNLALIYKSTGNMALARETLRRYCVVC